MKLQKEIFTWRLLIGKKRYIKTLAVLLEVRYELLCCSFVNIHSTFPSFLPVCPSLSSSISLPLNESNKEQKEQVFLDKKEMAAE